MYLNYITYGFPHHTFLFMNEKLDCCLKLNSAKKQKSLCYAESQSLSHFFYYNKSQNSNRYPFANEYFLIFRLLLVQKKHLMVKFGKQDQKCIKKFKRHLWGHLQHPLCFDMPNLIGSLSTMYLLQQILKKSTFGIRQCQTNFILKLNSRQ